MKKEDEPLKKFYEEPKLTAETFAVEDVVTTGYNTVNPGGQPGSGVGSDGGPENWD